MRLNVERRNVISLILVFLFFTTVIGAVYHTRLSWEDAKYAMISKKSDLVKELLKEHPDAKYTVEEVEFYQEMYPYYRRFEHLWDPSRGTRWVVYWWTRENTHRYHRPDLMIVIWPYNNEIIYETRLTEGGGGGRLKELCWSLEDWIIRNLHLISASAILFIGLLSFRKTREPLLRGLRSLEVSRFEMIIFTGMLLLAGFILAVITGILTHLNEDALYTSILSEETEFAVRLSLWTSIISTILIFVVALPSAYVTARYDFWGRSLIDTLLDLPLALPTIVGGIGLLMLFSRTSVGVYLSDNGIKIALTPLAIVLAQFFVNVPFMVRPFRSTFMSISPTYEYIARTLGCSRTGAFFRVLLPMARPGLIAGVAITWARCIGEFGACLMFAGATRFKTEVLPITVFLNMSTGEMELAISAAVIMIIISATMLFIFEKIGAKGASL